MVASGLAADGSGGSAASAASGQAAGVLLRFHSHVFSSKSVSDGLFTLWHAGQHVYSCVVLCFYDVISFAQEQRNAISLMKKAVHSDMKDDDVV